MIKTVFSILMLLAVTVAAVFLVSSSGNVSDGATNANSSLSSNAGAPSADNPEEVDSSESESLNELDEATGSYVHQSLATDSPGMNTFAAPSAGMSTKLPRSYAEAPALIPHSVAGLAITKDNNACIGCHSVGLNLGEDHVATLIPESHYTDLQTGEKQTRLVGRRYNCLTCHVPQASAEPLVSN